MASMITPATELPRQEGSRGQNHQFPLCRISAAPLYGSTASAPAVADEQHANLDAMAELYGGRRNAVGLVVAGAAENNAFLFEPMTSKAAA